MRQIQPVTNNKQNTRENKKKKQKEKKQSDLRAFQQLHSHLKQRNIYATTLSKAMRYLYLFVNTSKGISYTSLRFFFHCFGIHLLANNLHYLLFFRSIPYTNNQRPMGQAMQITSCICLKSRILMISNWRWHFSFVFFFDSCVSENFGILDIFVKKGKTGCRIARWKENEL